ncbi:TonB-dependent receptor, partial [bacterium]
GDYFIINVPPGTYTLQARMIGYTTQSQTGISVSVDRTTTVNVRLQQTVLEGQEVTVVAEREIVPMDVSASQVVATAEEIVEIPLVEDIGEFLNLQVGIEDDMIRGGGLDAAGFMMDGLLVVDNRTNSPIMAVNLSAIQELNVIKGGFNAEYGNVRTGLINVVTKEGEERYHGSLDFRFTPAYQKHSGPNWFDPTHYNWRSYMDPAVCYVGTVNGTWDAYKQEQNVTFIGWNAVSAAALADTDPTNDQTPEQARDQMIWLARLHEGPAGWDIPGANALLQKYGSSLADYKTAYGRDSHEIEYADKPDMNMDVSFSGPVPLIGKYLGGLNFFTSYRANWDAWALPIGWDDPSYFFEQNLQQKLTTRLSGSMKLTLEGLYGEIRSYGRSRNSLSESNYYGSGSANAFMSDAQYPGHYPPFNVYRTMWGLAFDHVLSPSTFYNVRISQLTVQNLEYAAFNPDPADMVVKLQDKWLTGDIPVRSDEKIMNMGQVAIGEEPYGIYYLGVKQFQNGMYYGSHCAGARDLGRGITFNLKFDLTSQVDKFNQVQTGFDFNYDDQYTYYHHIRIESEWENRYVEYRHYPYRLGAYVQDKLEFEGMIANIGLRLDYNEPNCDWPTVDRFSPYFNVDNKHLLFSTDELLEKAKGHVKISPRVGVSHPISANAKLYFNYGHFYSMPSSSAMYQVHWGRQSDGISSIGNPNLDLPKTVAYELGLDYDISNMYLLHAAGYYRDITDQTGNVSYVNYDNTVNYSTRENRNYADTRGFEIRLDKRYGTWWTAWAQFNYMVTTSGYIGRTAYYEDPNRQRTEGFENPQLNRPVSRPSARANLRLFTPDNFGPEFAGIHPIGSFSVNFLLSWQSGRVQTWDPLETGELENNLRWKATHMLDIRISKRFRIGGFNFQLFADIQNALDSELWSTSAHTGDDSDRYLKSLKLEMYGDPEYADDYASEGMVAGNDKPGELRSDDKPYINDPSMEHRMYNDIRHVILGITFDF